MLLGLCISRNRLLEHMPGEVGNTQMTTSTWYTCSPRAGGRCNLQKCSNMTQWLYSLRTFQLFSIKMMQAKQLGTSLTAGADVYAQLFNIKTSISQHPAHHPFPLQKQSKHPPSCPRCHGTKGGISTLKKQLDHIAQTHSQPSGSNFPCHVESAGHWGPSVCR